jgi:hypothetical protein
MNPGKPQGIAVRLSKAATVDIAGADKVDSHDRHEYKIALELNASYRPLAIIPCLRLAMFGF